MCFFLVSILESAPLEESSVLTPTHVATDTRAPTAGE